MAVDEVERLEPEPRGFAYEGAGMALALELDSDLRTTPAPRDTAILSYEPGTVDTAMQEEARTKSLAEYPWGRMFRAMHAKGVLVPPSAPAAESATSSRTVTAAERLRFLRRRGADGDSWHAVELARHQDRPYTLDYLTSARFCDDFVELQGHKSEVATEREHDR